MWVGVLVPWSMCGGQRPPYRDSLSTPWNLGTKPRPFSMVAGALDPLSHLDFSFFSAYNKCRNGGGKSAHHLHILPTPKSYPNLHIPVGIQRIHYDGPDQYSNWLSSTQVKINHFGVEGMSLIFWCAFPPSPPPIAWFLWEEVNLKFPCLAL